MNNSKSRREFLLNAGRVSAVAAITWSMGRFIVRTAEADCVGHSICDACEAVKSCDLPLGVDYKAKNEQDPRPIKLKEHDHAG